MVKNIPQRIREKILLHNPDLSEQEKRYLELYGAVNKYSLRSILAKVPDLSSDEKRIIKSCVYYEKSAELQKIVNKMVAKLYETFEPENSPLKKI